jgi:hypothetical protein
MRETSSERVARPRTRPGLVMRLAGRGGYGVLPQGAFGGGYVYGALVMGRARLELGVGAGFAGKFVLTESVSRRPLHLSVMVAGCMQRTRRRLDLRGCLGFEAGNVAVRRPESLPWPWTVHLVGAPSLTWWFHGRVGVYAGVGVGLALVRPNFYVGPAPGDQALAERAVPPLAVSGTLGVEFRGRSR